MNGIAQLTIDGQAIGLKFGLPAIRQIGEKGKHNILFEGANYTEVGIAHILYAGYINNCIIKDELPAKLTFEPFYNLVEEAVIDNSKLEQIKDALKAFEESRFVKTATEAVVEEGTKKKNLPTMKSKVSATDS